MDAEDMAATAAVRKGQGGHAGQFGARREQPHCLTRIWRRNCLQYAAGETGWTRISAWNISVISGSATTSPYSWFSLSRSCAQSLLVQL